MAITLNPIKKQIMSFSIKGTSPLIQHKWSEKALREMKEKQAGKKTKNRDARNPEKEFQDACYLNDDSEFGIPLMAFKKALITASHKDIGIEKTLVRKSVFVKTNDTGLIAKMECDEPIMREDMVRVGAGSADIRYRPEFRNWSVDIDLEIDSELLKPEDLINLVNRAGFGVGIGEWRPEKNGDYGRFKVDETKPVNIN